CPRRWRGPAVFLPAVATVPTNAVAGTPAGSSRSRSRYPTSLGHTRRFWSPLPRSRRRPRL
ncbi:MAG: hypothetical protein AVDCRST_MAG13-681, partial [uncultured Solirubrobacteraceae bacterium]